MRRLTLTLHVRVCGQSSVLQNAIEAWRAPCGERGAEQPSICQQLEAVKRVFLEPIKATADEFDARLNEYPRPATTATATALSLSRSDPANQSCLVCRHADTTLYLCMYS